MSNTSSLTFLPLFCDLGNEVCQRLEIAGLHAEPPLGTIFPTKRSSPVARLCRRYQVLELAIFGSFLHGNFQPYSEFDLLVEFAPEAEIGLLTLARMRRELSEIFNRQVVLVPKLGLKPKIRKEIIESRKVLYAA